MKEIQIGEFVIIPGRISHAQFGCSPMVFKDHIEGKEILVVDKSPDGQFYTLYANNDLYMAHAELLVSDAQYQINKDKERANPSPIAMPCS
jgi:hypothetical protein